MWQLKKSRPSKDTVGTMQIETVFLYIFINFYGKFISLSTEIHSLDYTLINNKRFFRIETDINYPHDCDVHVMRKGI